MALELAYTSLTDFLKTPDAHSQLSGFRCGRAGLDEFLENDTPFFFEQLLTKTTIVTASETGDVVAYFSLCASDVRLSDSERADLEMGANCAEQLHISTFPAIKITQLAVDDRYQGKGIGRRIIQSIEGMAYASPFAARFLFVDAANELGIEEFYRKAGFTNGLYYDHQVRQSQQQPQSTVPLFKDILGIVAGD